MSVERYYRGWHLANEAVIAAVKGLTADQLALPVAGAPMWATVAHLAGVRVYWLCHVFGEPGAETTPFQEPGVGWEDDLSQPRSADELVGALTSTWRVVQRCLDTWTPDTLGREAQRELADGRTQLHTRQSVLLRMITHDAYHSGELAVTLGAHGLGGTSPNGPIDMWSGLSRLKAGP